MTFPVDIAELYAAGRPFAFYRFPGEDAIRVAGKDGLFYVNCWNTPSKDNVHVAAARAGAPEVHPWPASTQRSAYLESTGRLIERLKSRGGKCVRSRVSSSGRVSLDLNSAVAELFGRFPDAFCHCYYTPQTGLWAGATPELLIDATLDAVKTMALAGTRPSGTDAPWDIKNIEEQSLVTQFICNSMQECGLNPVIGETHTLRYGAIEHICTDISARSRAVDVPSLLDALSPTPAVAGYPRAVALAEIEEFEDAPRRCYSGYVMVAEASGRSRAYVNLRCAQLSPDGWCVYAGGGITPRSNPAEEWRELEAKSAVWLEILKNNSLSPDE